MNEIYLDNRDFHLLVSRLGNKIKPIIDKIDWVVGIERGGLPISNWLSYAFGKKHQSILISFSDLPNGQISLKSLNTWGWSKFLNEIQNSSILLVDDIVDSGRTVKFFKSIVAESIKTNGIWVASLHWCPENSPECEPDFYVETKKKDEWIVYPWEKSDETILETSCH
jgi:hypoxanthine phosphoribosyltransferase